ncbi:hypothetical protein MKW94_016818, partial [Papaver nudicaule]|nr:hypothetical protein [Papaver nudicaule]
MSGAWEFRENHDHQKCHQEMICKLVESQKEMFGELVKSQKEMFDKLCKRLKHSSDDDEGTYILRSFFIIYIDYSNEDDDLVETEEISNEEFDRGGVEDEQVRGIHNTDS